MVRITDNKSYELLYQGIKTVRPNSSVTVVSTLTNLEGKIIIRFKPNILTENQAMTFLKMTALTFHVTTMDIKTSGTEKDLEGYDIVDGKNLKVELYRVPVKSIEDFTPDDIITTDSSAMTKVAEGYTDSRGNIIFMVVPSKYTEFLYKANATGEQEDGTKAYVNSSIWVFAEEDKTEDIFNWSVND